MKTYPSEAFVEEDPFPRTSAWNRILDLGTRAKAAFHALDHRSQLVGISIVAFVLVYGGLGFLRMVAVIVFGAKAIPDMFIDWWWIALLKLIS